MIYVKPYLKNVKMRQVRNAHEVSVLLDDEHAYFVRVSD